MTSRVMQGLTVVLACGAVGLGIDTLVMQDSEAPLHASGEAHEEHHKLAEASSRVTALSTPVAATRDDFLRTLLQSNANSGVTIQRVELSASASLPTAEAPIALTLEGEYRAVKDRLLAWTAAPTAARLQAFMLARAPGGDGRIVADVVVLPPHAPGRP